MSKPIVDWGFSCGRAYLTVNGYVAAMECDPLRDGDLARIDIEHYERVNKDSPHWEALKTYNTGKVWSEYLIKYVCALANGEQPPPMNSKNRMKDTNDFLAWGLRTTPKKVGKMKISELQAAWLESGLPPVDVVMRSNDTGKVTPLFRLGPQDPPKRKAPKAKAKSKPVARPKSR